MTLELKTEYGLPQQLLPFIADGFLKVLAERKDQTTIEFHIPSKRLIDAGASVAA